MNEKHIPSNTGRFDVGVIHGRFQILHNDHIKYLLAGKSLCNHLIVGITNPDPMHTKSEESAPERSASSENPLTYYERYLLVRAAFKENGISPNDYTIVPFPVNFPDMYQYYVPLDACFFLTIYDDWGKRKQQYFQDLGLDIHVLWEVPLEEKGISAKDIRQKMIAGTPWEHMVPGSVATLLNKWDIPGRLKTLTN